MEALYMYMFLYVFQMLPVTTNIRDAYQRGTDDEQIFIQNLSLFLCTFLKEHAPLIEKKPDLNESLMAVSNYVYICCQSLAPGRDLEIYLI